MATNDFDQKLIRMERDVRDLKTAQQLSPRIRGYSRQFTLGELSGGQQVKGHVRITYGEGQGEILTEFVSDLSIWPATPTGIYQDINCMANTGSAQINAPILVLSTRPITAVTLVE